MTNTQPLLCQSDDRGVTTLTLNRPECRNALDGELVAALVEQLQKLEQDKATRVVVLTGNGRVFCSGADLAWIEQVVEQGEVANLNDARLLADMMQRLNAFAKPVLALVNGPAFGGGLGLIACCDIAIAVDTAEFAFSEVRLGLVAAVIAPYIQSAIGPRQARRLLLTAERFSAGQALELGLVHHVATEASLEAVFDRQLAHLLQGEPVAQSESKRLLQSLLKMDENLSDQTAESTARIRATQAAESRIQAFLSRRKNQ
ncbi:MAG: enoyl-CoA hydratase/isomerase family protein [Candidatus Thiodiazotropha sp. (ex Monitilora ramsayi)]|nr:enoyl-CoA hydratase/isomerase family protein [Candidatus Thiodiazotropha sp. (ex Monitilora ramsayi)]